MKPIEDIWVYLATTPLLHLTLTLVAYSIGETLYERLGRLPILNPVLLAVIALAGLLIATDTSYAAYFEGAQFVHFLLGPATVALAIPLYRQIERVRKSALPLVAAICAGSTTAIASALVLTWVAGADLPIIATVTPKSATTPVAMAIAEGIGGLPSLTAVMVILTGIVGATLGPPLLSLMRVTDEAARGVALGTASHGIGTARAMAGSDIQGAFSGLAMGLNALATTLLVPLIWLLLS
ncbi:LrgB family protein [Notoacmeibacter sp. MSK16QG-6]|uniref:LrgB family protein n=1 Tax=Notoacmeibacter sp. MSK16QG-6 TaxID=2957982 RepID=UPI00209E9170|nr:LrgB family protein [Notoacmeibacter sp. MSK16QG-6]MCP1199825.1 LrgB family protein [Notoacmeibacter sp. MSK16QG-6]